MYKVINIIDSVVFLADQNNEIVNISIEKFDFIPNVGDRVTIFHTEDSIIVKKESHSPIVIITAIAVAACILLGVILLLPQKEFEYRDSRGQSVSETTEVFTQTSEMDTTIIDTTVNVGTAPTTTPVESIPELNVNELYNYNFTSIAGIWENENGQRFVFDKFGLTDTSKKITDIGTNSDGSIYFSVVSGPSGFSIGVYPKGISIKGLTSDLEKDRIIAGQVMPTSSGEIYYRLESAPLSNTSEIPNIEPVDITVEVLGDLENEGLLEEGQLYRMTVEMFRKDLWYYPPGLNNKGDEHYEVLVKSQTRTIAGYGMLAPESEARNWNNGTVVEVLVIIVNHDNYDDGDYLPYPQIVSSKIISQ